jgi:hypothetical protein
MSTATAKLELVAADAMNRIARAADRLDRLNRQLEEARQELQDAIREAHAAGVSVAAIARTTSLTTQRIHQILQER